MAGQLNLGQARSSPQLQTSTEYSSKIGPSDDSRYDLSSPSLSSTSRCHRKRRSFDVGRGSSISSLPAYADIFSSSPNPALIKSLATNPNGNHSSTSPETEYGSKPERKKAFLPDRSARTESNRLDEERETTSTDLSEHHTIADAIKTPFLTSDSQRRESSLYTEVSEPLTHQTPRSNSLSEIQDYHSPSPSSLLLSPSSLSLSSSLATRSEHDERLSSIRSDEDSYQFEDPSVWLDRMLTKSTSALATAQVLLSGALGVRGALYDWIEREAEGEGALGRIWVETQCRSRRDDDHAATLTSLSNETLLVLGGRPSNGSSSSSYLSPKLKSTLELGRGSIAISDVSTTGVERDESIISRANSTESPKQEDPVALPSVGRTRSSLAVEVLSAIQSPDRIMSPTFLSASPTTSTPATKGWSPSTLTNRGPSSIRVQSSPVDSISSPSSSSRDRRNVRPSTGDFSPLTSRSVKTRVDPTRPADEVCTARGITRSRTNLTGEEERPNALSTAEDYPCSTQKRENSLGSRSNVTTSMMNVRSNQKRYSLSFPPEKQSSPLNSPVSSTLSPTLFTTNCVSSPNETQRLGSTSNRHSVEFKEVDETPLSIRAVHRENQMVKSSEALVKLRNLGSGCGEVTGMGGVEEGEGGKKSWVAGWFGSS